MQHAVNGLTNEEVLKSRNEHGTNTITPQETESFWDKLIDNFKDPMIIILVAALGIVMLLAVMHYAEWYEGVGIAAAVILATFVSTASEHKNEQTFQKLQEEASKIILNVFREGHVQKVGIDDIVVGDCVLLQPGDKIPADGSIIIGEVKVNQAMFNGEPEPVSKSAGRDAESAHETSLALSSEERQQLASDLDNPHRVFRGTTVEDGEAVMQVDTVGDKTLFGKLANELSVEDREGPLRTKLGILAGNIAKFGYIGAAFIVAAFMFKVILLDNQFSADRILAYLYDWHKALYDVVTAAILAVIIIVVAVPEGLPMMIAIVLSQNMRKLLNSNVLVRQLLGIETAGSLNILFCDKTGTITKGALEAVSFETIGHGPEDGEQKTTCAITGFSSFNEIPQKLKELLDLSLRENTSCVTDITAQKESERIIGGNATERSLLKFIHADIQNAVHTETGFEVTKEIYFNSIRKFSAAQLEWKDGRTLTLIKGAPEKILNFCSSFYCSDTTIYPLSEQTKQRLNEDINRKSDQGFRILALATSQKPLDDTLPEEMTLLGFIAIRDTLREESIPAIRTLHQAGIQVVMLTGDRLGTAKAIAKDAGLLTSDQDVVMESSDLNALSDEELKKVMPHLKIIARCLPQDKKRLIKAAQEMGLVVGMTGDGVNDSPALSNSDIGFGMGSGSEVAKEASSIVILDDNIRSIVNAVHYGRTIYRSIQKFIVFQLTVSISAILIAFVGPFLGYRLPLTMIQLLWINLIMDTLAALALSGEPPLEKHLKEKPKQRDERIIEPGMWNAILLRSLFIAGLAVFFLKSDSVKTLFHSDRAFETAFFAFFALTNAFNNFNVRADGFNLFEHIIENTGFLEISGLILVVQVLLTYFGGDVFRTVGLQAREWVYVFGMAILVIPFDLARKAVVRS